MLVPDSFSDPLVPPHTLQKEIRNDALSEDPSVITGLPYSTKASSYPKSECSCVLDIADSDVQRKRTYLASLPPDQIIELCLTFERHVPSSVRASLWPPDLDSEIMKLQNARTTEVELSKSRSPPPKTLSGTLTQSARSPAVETLSQQIHLPGAPPFELPVQPLDSASSAVVEKSTVAVESESKASDRVNKICSVVTETSSKPNLTEVSTESLAAKLAAGTSAVEKEQDAEIQPFALQPGKASSSKTQLEAENAQTTSSATTAPATPGGSTTPQPTPTHLAQYHYPPYAYPGQPGYPPSNTQAAYPHAPYYAPSTSTMPGYHAPYSGYPHYPPAPGYATHAHQPPPPSSGEDLPSYEDMIVEALTDLGEPDGAAPKDLFLWMASRWPLQTNFRPSASQALQKAYQRKRLEKTDGGRYRLNPNWEGGAVSVSNIYTFESLSNVHTCPRSSSSLLDIEKNDSSSAAETDGISESSTGASGAVAASADERAAAAASCGTSARPPASSGN